MAKTIRKTFHKDFSLGILFIIFVTVFFMSGQLFSKYQTGTEWFAHIYLGMFLVSTAVIIMILILWEEILFPVKVIPVTEGVLFRNHTTKLKVQAIIYLFIPAIVAFLYFNFKVDTFRFFSWAGVCIVLPVVAKLITGINNYHDYLKLTSSAIEYKNNEKEGVLELKDVEKLELIKDEDKVLSKLILDYNSGDQLTIDLDEMELEAFYDSIEEYIQENYKELLK